MRKKEIEKASICQYQIIGTIGEQEVFKNGFVKGAEWADKTMIEKACEWLWYEIYERIEDERIKEALMDDNYRANLVNAFRKAMEE